MEVHRCERCGEYIPVGPRLCLDCHLCEEYLKRNGMLPIEDVDGYARLEDWLREETGIVIPSIVVAAVYKLITPGEKI